MRARPLTIAKSLMPTIGLKPRETRARRRAAQMHWPVLAQERAIVDLRLSIQSIWNFALSLNNTVQHRHASFVAAASSEPAEVSRNALHSTVSRQPLIGRSMFWNPWPRAVKAIHRTRAAFVITHVTPRRMPSERDDHNQAQERFTPAARRFPASRANATRQAGGAFRGVAARVLRPIALRAARLRHSTRAPHASAPQRTTSAFASASTQSILRTLPERLVVANSHRSTVTMLHSVQRRQRTAPLPAQNAAARRSTPSSVAQTRRDRVPVDLAWRSKADGRSSARDFATLARSVNSAPTLTHAVAVANAHAVPPAPMSVQPPVPPDAGQLVEEVMSRLDRRMRSDRLRRGL